MSDALDQLLDSTLDDLDDLPSFQPFPRGAHRVLATFGTKEIGGKEVVTLDFKIIETMELANSQDTAAKEGDSSGTIFMIDNEYGLGNLKKCAAHFAKMIGSSGLRAIVEGVKEVECVIVTGIRTDKNDPDKKYLDVKDIQVV